MNDFRAVLLACLHDVLEAHWVAFREVRAFNPYKLRILEVTPRIRHGAAAKRSTHGWRRIGMADARLIVDVNDAKSTGHLDVLIAFLIVDLRTADEGKAVGTADFIRLSVNLLSLLPALFAGILHGLGRAVNGLIPADFFPVVAARCTVQRLRCALLGIWDCRIAKPLAAECAAIDWAVYRTFELNELAILDIADDAAAAGAEMAD